ncbi:MAG: hypothetical protein ACI9FJ_000577 [Alteromonadaceae bacterium]|jgi:hypothetical protein
MPMITGAKRILVPFSESFYTRFEIVFYALLAKKLKKNVAIECLNL